MSASLVGSEMCIRDRPPFPMNETLPPSPDTTRCSGHSPPPDTQHRRSPVSYTHLTLPTICSV
eukprot:7218730-Alexandrium_andersonii.AAC.1